MTSPDRHTGPRIARSVLRRALGRRRVLWVWAPIEVYGPHSTRLRLAAWDGHHCFPFSVPREFLPDLGESPMA